jgi:hypothetical protein
MTLKATLITMTAALALTMGAHAVEKDYNGDGYSDLIWEDVVTGQRGFWWMRNENVIGYNWVRYANMQVVPPLPVSWHIVGTSDFVDDNHTDIVWQDSITGAAQIWYVKNDILICTRPVLILTQPFQGQGALVPLGTTGLHLQIVAVGQDYTGYVDITMVAPDGTIAVEYYQYVGGQTSDTNGTLNRLYTSPSDPNSPINGGKLQPGWRIAGEFVNPSNNFGSYGYDFGGYYDPSESDQNGVVLENMNDGRIAFAHLKTANEGATSGPYQYSTYTISGDRVGGGWQVAGSGKFFGAGNYGDYTSYALGRHTSLVLENASTGQHVIWVFNYDYQSLAAGYWLPNDAPEWRVANH